ncbi:hypothetical protein AAG906_007851 [Vitis piasezkii]
MKDNETIIEMITMFTDIVNGLEALRNTYKKLEKVVKILRLLPSKWNAKVISIQEAKDMTKIPLEDLIGSLMTHEINLTKKQQEREDKKKKSVTLKATTKEEEEVEEEKQRVKSLEKEGSFLEKTPLKRNLHPMVTRRDRRRKETWCASSIRNRVTLNMIVLYTKVKPRGERIRQ